MAETKSLTGIIKSTILPDLPADSGINAINLKRLKISLYFLIPIHLVYALFFRFAPPGSEALTDAAFTQWQTIVFYSHGLMLILATAALAAFYLIQGRNREASPAGRSLPVLVAAAYLVMGTVLSFNNQTLAPSITPYLIAGLAVAAVVLLQPLSALILYAAAGLVLIIILPFFQSESALLLSMQAGGAGVSAAGFFLALILVRAKAVELDHVRLITRQKEQLEKKDRRLELLASTDMMTGLYNRMHFTEFAERELARIKRTGEESCLIILDLDHFKEINDRYGQPNGDIVLKLIAGVIKGQLRATDTLARFSGEEFTILLPGTTLKGAENVAEKIRLAVEGCSFTGQLEDIQITASFGVAKLPLDDAATFDSAYRLADAALARAKGKGYNRVECAGKQ